MFQYYLKIKDLLEIVMREEAKSITKAIEMLTKAHINKQSIYIFGASHAGILTEELFYRAGGMMTINPIFGKELMLDTTPITLTSKMERLEGYGNVLASKVDFNDGDVLMLHSVSGRNPVTIDMALYAKEKGVQTMAITNLKYSRSVSSRHSSNKHLFEIVDVVIDNHGDIGDGACTIDGIKQKVGPTSTVVGATILNSIIVEVCTKLAAINLSQVPVFYSANIDGGDERNQQLFHENQETIHYRLV